MALANCIGDRYHQGLRFRLELQKAFMVKMTSVSKKELANTHFKNHEYETACRLYSEILAEDPENYIVLANRSAALLTLGRFQGALNDALAVLAAEPNHVKTIYRAAKAYCGLKQYKEAIERLNSVPNKAINNPADKSMVEKLKAQANVYLKQQSSGEYDMMAFLGSEGQPVYHDVADYFGPLELVNVPGKGRGLIATEDIASGQLIIASKAFAIKFQHDNPILLLPVIDGLLKKNPETVVELYKLYAGPELGFLEPDASSLSEKDLTDEKWKADPKRIMNIIKYNGFSCQGVGVWIEPSFINTDCLHFNCIYCDYGDVLLVRAVRDIKKGDEILVTYTKARYSYLARKSLLLQMYGFECVCQLCQYQSKEDPDLMQRRGVLLEYFRGKVSAFRLSLDEVEEKINELESLCVDSPDIFRKHYMFTPSYVLAMAYADTHEFRKSTELLEVLAMNPELNLTTMFGPYGLGGHLRTALNQLLCNYAMTNDKVKARQLFPLILANFEVAEGKVGLQGFLLSQPPQTTGFIKAISK